MNSPIWVWLYDYGSINHPNEWKWVKEARLTYPQAHTYAFLTEKEALAHPEKVNWSKDHGYILQKTYLQTEKI